MDIMTTQEYFKRQSMLAIGEFHPVDEINLKAMADNSIGRKYIIQYLWVIDEGEYKGEWAVAPLFPRVPGFDWAPESDWIILLDDINLVINQDHINILLERDKQDKDFSHSEWVGGYNKWKESIIK